MLNDNLRRKALSRGHLYIFLLFLTTKGFAFQYFEPWFTPPMEFQGRIAFIYNHDHRVQSPKGSFSIIDYDYTFNPGAGVTPCSFWNIQTDLFLTQSTGIDSYYEAFFLTVRYLWLNDLAENLFALTTGISFSFPGSEFLKDISSGPYHGEVNTTFHATVGKEWLCGDAWLARLWVFGGMGIANSGSPWLPGVIYGEIKMNNSLTFGIFAEFLYGLGDKDIIKDEPFEGYGPINHRSINIGGSANYELGSLATFSLQGWYNVHAHNTVEHSHTLQATLTIPFKIFSP